jgi:hypothetical protein
MKISNIFSSYVISFLLINFLFFCRTPEKEDSGIRAANGINSWDAVDGGFVVTCGDGRKQFVTQEQLDKKDADDGICPAESFKLYASNILDQLERKAPKGSLNPEFIIACRCVPDGNRVLLERQEYDSVTGRRFNYKYLKVYNNQSECKVELLTHSDCQNN